MSLNLMLDIVSGLNSKWQHALADELCALWGCTDAVYIRASSNVIFRCKYNDKTFYLRFNKGKEQQWHNEIELLIHLHHHDIPCVKPIRSLAGRFVESYDGYCAVMFEALEGIQKETSDLSNEELFTWGKALGLLHKATAEAPISHQYRHYTELLDEYEIYVTKPEMLAELRELLQKIQSLPQGRHYGIIHADLEQDNLYWKDNDIPSSLDYDDSCRMWYAADLAFALRDLYQEDNTEDKLILFRKGYSSVSLQAIDLYDWIPSFLRLHDFMQYIRIKKAMDIPPYREIPDWMAKLIKHLTDNFLTKIEHHNMYKYY